MGFLLVYLVEVVQ